MDRKQGPGRHARRFHPRLNGAVHSRSSAPAPRLPRLAHFSLGPVESLVQGPFLLVEMWPHSREGSGVTGVRRQGLEVYPGCIPI
jgi:hypothetical protein